MSPHSPGILSTENWQIKVVASHRMTDLYKYNYCCCDKPGQSFSPGNVCVLFSKKHSRTNSKRIWVVGFLLLREQSGNKQSKKVPCFLILLRCRRILKYFSSPQLLCLWLSSSCTQQKELEVNKSSPLFYTKRSSFFLSLINTSMF